MNAEAKKCLNEVVAELRIVTRELNSVASGVQSYHGIGTNYCAAKLERLARKYDKAKGRLQNLD